MKLLLTLALSSLGAAPAQAQIGLNIYCDPLDTAYAGGNPLFDPASGELTAREDYLAAKGLNMYCDPLETAYAGGNPLFDFTTGESISLEDYLAQKPIPQLNDR